MVEVLLLRVTTILINSSCQVITKHEVFSKTEVVVVATFSRAVKTLTPTQLLPTSDHSKFLVSKALSPKIKY